MPNMTMSIQLVASSSKKHSENKVSEIAKNNEGTRRKLELMDAITKKKSKLNEKDVMEIDEKVKQDYLRGIWMQIR